MERLGQNEVIIPFHMEIVPITKLMLFNFDKDPEDIYTGLEFQYLVTKNEGCGYRMIGYRNDQYVDVYDEESLKISDVGNFAVCGKGLANYRNIPFQKAYFELTDKGLQLEFSLVDYTGRRIDAVIKENGKKKSRPIDLIAPVGVSSIKPVNLPVFAMYQFDFVRKRNTEIMLRIGNRDIKLDSFPAPIPKDGQRRYFTRYGYDCELVEFCNAEDTVLSTVKVDTKITDNHITVKHNEYLSTLQVKENTYSLEKFKFQQSKHRFELQFEEAFPDILRMKNGTQKGTFRIIMDAIMGEVIGDYQVSKKDNVVEIVLTPSGGWNVEKRVFLTKMMFGKKSVFCSWPTTYQYRQVINIETNASSCSWKRINFTPKEKYI